MDAELPLPHVGYKIKQSENIPDTSAAILRLDFIWRQFGK